MGLQGCGAGDRGGDDEVLGRCRIHFVVVAVVIAIVAVVIVVVIIMAVVTVVFLLIVVVVIDGGSIETGVGWWVRRSVLTSVG